MASEPPPAYTEKEDEGQQTQQPYGIAQGQQTAAVLPPTYAYPYPVAPAGAMPYMVSEPASTKTTSSFFIRACYK